MRTLFDSLTTFSRYLYFLDSVLENGSDSQELVKAINSKSYSVELYGVFFDIEVLSLSFASVLFSYVLRYQNVTAGSLAKNALRLATSLY